MENIIENDITSSIVSSVLSLYNNDGMNLFFRYDNKFMPLLTFLSLLVPSIDALNWPLDKDDLPRIWHDVYVITDDVTEVSVDRVLPGSRSSRPSEEVILHRSFLFDTVSKVAGRRVPNMNCLNIDPITGIHTAPVSEIRVSTFQTSWFLSHEPYLKRFRLLKEASVTTLFVAKKVISDGTTRYNLTWLPHVHLNPQEVHKRRGSAWAIVPCPTEKVVSSTGVNSAAGVGITVLVWNVQGSATLRFASNFVNLIKLQIPDMVILAGIDALTDRARKITTGVGYTKCLSVSRDAGAQNGLFLFWDPMLITVDEAISYASTKNLRIKLKTEGSSKARGWNLRNLLPKVHHFNP